MHSGVKVNIHNSQTIGRYGKLGMCKRKKRELYSPLDRNRRDIPMTVDKRLSRGTVPLEVQLRGPWRVRG
jgi:hypothetical protein